MDDKTPAVWRKSSYSSAEGANCVEVAVLPSGPAVRDSKDTAVPALTFTTAAWSAFTAAVRSGEFG